MQPYREVDAGLALEISYTIQIFVKIFCTFAKRLRVLAEISPSNPFILNAQVFPRQ